MIVKKDVIVSHLTRLSADKNIPEAVLDGYLGGAAVNANQQLIVVVPPLPKVSPISSEDLGIVDLELVINALKGLSAEGGEVGIEFKENKLHIEQRHGGKLRFATSSTTLIGTVVAKDKVEAAVQFVKDSGTSIPLGQTIVQGVIETVRLLKAETIQVVVGKEGGSLFIGEEVRHNASFDLPSLKVKDDQAPYILPLSASIVTAVFKQISDYSQAALVLTGPDSLVAVSEGEYFYLISPQETE